jgi:hypothetical protein
MSRISPDNFLATSSQSRWLVTSDMLWEAVDVIELKPWTDLVRALTAAMQRYQDNGWNVETTDTQWGFFFMNKGGVRMEVGIRHRRPETTAK